MEAANRKIADVFSSGGNIHYVLPHFQREYIWDQEQWETLVNDLIFVYEDYLPDKEPEHFLGSVVVINDGTKNGTTPVFKLVDGQQRLITISLMLCVLRELTKIIDPTLAIDPQLPSKIEMMLVNFYETDELRFKVFPSTKYNDRAVYISILKGTPPDKEVSNIAAAYHFLHNKLSDEISEREISIELLYTVLINCFQVVLITLNSQSESPYKIFESLNAKGKPLSQADKVRNYIAMTLPSDVQESVFEKDWAKIEELLQEQNKIGQVGELTAFLRHYLAMQRTILPSEEHVYPRFRSYIEQDHSTPQAFVEEIAGIRRFAEYYDKLLRPEHEFHPDISKALVRLNTLDASTAYPLLLAAYNAFASGNLPVKDFLSFMSVLENHMVRRYICAERTNNLNKWYPTVWREIVQYQETLPFTDACRKALSAKYYPSDRQVQQSIREMKLYGRTAQHRAKVTLILETIEYHLWVGTDVILRLNGKSTIEHIMPQAPTPAWKNALGKNWQQTYFEYMHTLGNLTLVTQGKNIQLSNLDFARKKQLLVSQGFRINSYFKSVNHWDESAICARADWLAQQVIEVWPSLIEDLSSVASLSVSKAAV